MLMGFISSFFRNNLVDSNMLRKREEINRKVALQILFYSFLSKKEVSVMLNFLFGTYRFGRLTGSGAGQNYSLLRLSVILILADLAVCVTMVNQATMSIIKPDSTKYKGCKSILKAKSSSQPFIK